MFMILRGFLVFFSLAFMVLFIFALTGSYKSSPYLTNTYLIDVHLYNLNLTALINTAIFESITPSSLGTGSNIKRATPTENDDPSSSLQVWGLDTNTETSNTESVPIVASTTTSEVFDSSIAIILNEVINDFNYQELGLADVYSIGFWGYCTGYISKDESTENQTTSGPIPFNNKHVNFTWCSHPKASNIFDPLAIFKTVLNGTINNIDLPFAPPSMVEAISSKLYVLLENINYDSVNLPGNLKKNLTEIGRISTACFALLVVVVCFCFVSIVIQVLAFFISPDNCCLSFLNFLFQVINAVLAVVTASLITGIYVYLRKQINGSPQFGIKSFLSVNLYAFIWSAAASAIIVVLLNLLGQWWGFFGTGRRRYRCIEDDDEEQVISYYQKQEEESSYEDL
ncbi:actin cortical patch SUR7/pH-response regulator pali [Scheffersomyces xylosifermentans]|uniref:actin cortical patch SUR7/pH-response regulator pali n=1 Tax=Scheffersomyces xylosifermentans TaxID=1304137 RepID=UPI00315D2167